MVDGVLSLSAGWLLSEITSASLEVEGTSIAGTTGEISGGKVSGDEGLAESLKTGVVLDSASFRSVILGSASSCGLSVVSRRWSTCLLQITPSATCTK